MPKLQKKLRGSHRAENGAQNPVVNDGYGQQSKRLKPNNTNIGCQQNNTPESNGSGEPQMFLWEDVLVVQELIERCMRLYMNKDQVVETLQVIARVVPEFTKLVWDELEEENTQFFEDYYTRVGMYRQKSKLNKLRKRQADLAEKLQRSPAVSHYAESTAIASSHSFPSRMNGNMPCGNILTNLPAGNGMGSSEENLHFPALPQRVWYSNTADGIVLPDAYFTGTPPPAPDVVHGSDFGTAYNFQAATLRGNAIQFDKTPTLSRKGNTSH